MLAFIGIHQAKRHTHTHTDITARNSVQVEYLSNTPDRVVPYLSLHF